MIADLELNEDTRIASAVDTTANLCSIVALLRDKGVITKEDDKKLAEHRSYFMAKLVKLTKLLSAVEISDEDMCWVMESIKETSALFGIDSTDLTSMLEKALKNE